MGILDASPRVRAAALTAPPFLYTLLLLAFPLGAVILISFMTQQGVALDTTFTTANYQRIATEPIFGALIGRSLLVASLVTLVTVVLAYPVAYYVSFHVRPERKALWLFIITIPFWTSYLIRVFLWRIILGFNGVVNTALVSLGIVDEPLTFILYNLNSVIITLAHAYAVFAILPIYVALEKIDRSLLEAAQDLGENRLTTFLRVTLPLSIPGVVGAVLIVFIPVIGDYVTPELMGGPGGRVAANMIQIQFLQLNNWPLGAALALVVMMVVGLVAALFGLVFFRWLRRRA